MSAISRLQRHVMAANRKRYVMTGFCNSARMEDRLIAVLAEAAALDVDADDLVKLARARVDEFSVKQQQPTGVKHE